MAEVFSVPRRMIRLSGGGCNNVQEAVMKSVAPLTVKNGIVDYGR